MLVGLDFETYGSVDLPKHGLDRYVRDKYFMPLIGDVYYQSNMPLRGYHHRFDFVQDMQPAKQDLASALREAKVAAHNAGFELEVLKWLGIELRWDQIVDSAVCARVAGAGSPLEQAAPQLLGIDKMKEGRDLIRLFSIPGKYQEEAGSLAFDPQIVKDHPQEWDMFKDYCGLDSKQGFLIAKKHPLSKTEQEFQAITLKMNQRGWHVDVKSVEEMHRRYLENLEAAEHDFHTRYGELNFNSLKQMTEFCHDRGIKAYSFDQRHVESMLKKIDAKLETMVEGEDKWHDYYQVQQMLSTKQILGGSSLKKLAVILETVGPDDRLRDQYLHCGASQTLRTTGRSTQMQNLPRLGEDPLDMNLLFDGMFNISNDGLADNLRQLFTARNPSGSLIVGDFRSVESAGLAWLAGEHWKTQAYREGRGVYEELAAKFGASRTFGKVGELSCGYQAGAEAVQEFAAKMGVELSLAEAQRLVSQWRDACPKTVEFWQVLDDMLHEIMGGRLMSVAPLADNFKLEFTKIETPQSLRLQAGEVPSLMIRVYDSQSAVFLERRFLGIHRRGRNVVYFKPSGRKTGALWKDHYVDPKTKQVKFYQIYGGKLAGILTQSFCRELFFRALKRVDDWAARFDNIDLVGQFHDEIVLDWTPNAVGDVGRDIAVSKLKELMSDPGLARTFPLSAEVKWDYRYIK